MHVITERVPTYIINLRFRSDRKENVLKEFEGKYEFNVTIVDAIQHQIGSIGLWKTIQYILSDLTTGESEFVLICEDDHQFTSEYSKEILLNSITKAKELGADILCGGVSWFSNAIRINETIWWVEKFTGTQFIILFKRAWKPILEADFGIYDTADLKLCSLTENVFLMCPFISIQKEYGYSDATPKNNQEGRIKELFESSREGVDINNMVTQRFNKRENNRDECMPADFHNVSIPVYAINLPERKERRVHIENQFMGKEEFDLTIIDACKHENGAYGLWLSIRKVIEIAIKNEDDVIIICEDDHEFTEHYSKEYLLKNIIEAHKQGVCYLSGGTSNFRYAIKAAPNRYWVSACRATQFMVLYKDIFNKILQEPFDETVIADLLLPELTSNKMVLYPFISVQKDFGYSDVTEVHNHDTSLVSRLFKESEKTMERINNAYNKYFMNS